MVPAFKQVQNLVAGDRVQIGRKLVRTVKSAGPNGYVNRRNVPLWTVMYEEGRTPEWGEGNSDLPTTIWVMAQD